MRGLILTLICLSCLALAWWTGRGSVEPLVVTQVRVDTVPFPWDSLMCAQHDWMEGR